MFQIIFGLFIAAENFEGVAPLFESIAAARGCAATLFRMIDRVPKIDAMCKEGLTNFDFEGNIEFRNVAFSYPSRPDAPILRELNIVVSAGQTVALVGSSGNGKSTCLQLLQRFYDPDAGQLLLDGYDIRHFNISTLRSCFGLVSQEPLLFSTSIGENIRYGRPDADENDIMAAAQDAGAHDFISRLPQGYNTIVGQKGCQMSGGQKQRIAIARALIRNPRILILDEATSALDYQSEKTVQRTLDSLSKGRTTIVVSHRISAIRNADRILFIDKGNVLEAGSHNDLIQLKGHYYDMIMAAKWDREEQKFSGIHESEENVHGKSGGQYKGLSQNVGGYVDTDERKMSHWKAFKRILTIARPEWIHLFLASLSAVFIGSSIAIFGILFGEFFGVSVPGKR